jgi:thioredoxin 1
VIEELAAEYQGRVAVAKVDIEKESALAARFKVMSIPTVILFDNGVEVKRFIGVQPKATYESAIDPLPGS